MDWMSKILRKVCPYIWTILSFFRGSRGYWCVFWHFISDWPLEHSPPEGRFGWGDLYSWFFPYAAGSSRSRTERNDVIRVTHCAEIRVQSDSLFQTKQWKTLFFAKPTLQTNALGVHKCHTLLAAGETPWFAMARNRFLWVWFWVFLHIVDAPFLKTSMLPMCSKVWDLTVRWLCGFHGADNYCQAHADIPGESQQLKRS